MVSIFDRGFVFGDGIYEVVPVIGGKMVDKAPFLERLKRSLGELRIDMPMSEDEFVAMHEKLIELNGIDEGGVYSQITRGVADRDFAFPAAGTTPSVAAFTMKKQLLDNANAHTGVKVVTVEDIRWKRRDIKSIALLGQVMAKQAAVEDLADVQQLQVMRPHKLSYVTQTTLSMDDTARVIEALRARFPAIRGPRKDDICYATQNRQDAVKRLAEQCDKVFVVGSTNSSNSNRLKELAEKKGVPACLIDDADEILPEWLDGVEVLGITAGASAPEVLVEGVIERCKELKSATVSDLTGPEENVTFALPRSLR